MSPRKIAIAIGFALAVPASRAAETQEPDIPALARELITVYRETRAETYFDNLMRARLVAGEYTLALQAADSLKAARARPGASLPPAVSFPYEVYAYSKLGYTIDSAFAARSRYIDDRSAATQLPYILGTSVPRIRLDHDSAVARASRSASLSLTEKLDLVRRRAALLSYEVMEPHISRLLAKDDERRYIITRDVIVSTPRSGKICTLVYLPRSAPGKLPTLLNFTIYDTDLVPYEARRSASNGYAAVGALTRGKGCSPNTPVSHEYDGSDAAAVIDWISRQPWSDGRVGMFGGSYEGMTQWAAAKHMPKALKAMMPSVTHAPGIDFPTDGNIFATYAYPWPFFTTSRNRGLDSAAYNDSDRWTKMQRNWYTGGRAYRALPDIDGQPNSTFKRWLDHPGYDEYWKAMVASDQDFRRIDIPVLTTTGYFDSGQMGALWFFRQHTSYLPDAEHYLLIGPYDHVSGQRGNIDPLGRRSQTNIQGIEVDSVANIDIGELRYQWFDYVFRGKQKPKQLKDKVNYVVMNANVWKHAPSLAAMSDSVVSVTLNHTMVQTVDLRDRSDADVWGPSGDLLDPSSSVRSLVDTVPNIAHAFMFTSEPLEEAIEVAGLFSARLDFEVNKKDFDFSVTLFELTRGGRYVQLAYHWQRASFARSRLTRSLLTPGKRTQLNLTSNRLIARRLEAGSRIAVVIAVPRNPSQQINYGSGKAVADETIADAGQPLTIEWHPATVIRVPVRQSR